MEIRRFVLLRFKLITSIFQHSFLLKAFLNFNTNTLHGEYENLLFDINFDYFLLIFHVYVLTRFVQWSYVPYVPSFLVEGRVRWPQKLNRRSSKFFIIFFFGELKFETQILSMQHVQIEYRYFRCILVIYQVFIFHGDF